MEGLFVGILIGLLLGDVAGEAVGSSVSRFDGACDGTEVISVVGLCVGDELLDASINEGNGVGLFAGLLGDGSGETVGPFVTFVRTGAEEVAKVPPAAGLWLGDETGDAVGIVVIECALSSINGSVVNTKSSASL